VDKSTEQVHNFAPGRQELRATGSVVLRVAQSADSTRGGTLGETARPAPTRAAAEARSLSCRTSSHLSERVLLRGYGLDPDDLERSMIERRR
jgi:hypothetical protein